MIFNDWSDGEVDVKKFKSDLASEVSLAGGWHGLGDGFGYEWMVTLKSDGQIALRRDTWQGCPSKWFSNAKDLAQWLKKEYSGKY